MNGVANGDTKIGVACFHSGPRVRSGLLEERKGVLSVCIGEEGDMTTSGRRRGEGEERAAGEGTRCKREGQ